MLRTILAVFAGLVAAIVAILSFEYIGLSLFPPPPGVRLETEAELAAFIAAAGTGKLLWVLCGWVVAASVGGWVAARVSRRHRIAAGLAVGALIVAGVALNVSMLPHPLWITVAGLLLPLPAAWLAARLAARTASTPPLP